MKKQLPLKILLIFFHLLLLSLTVKAQAPANDNFDNRKTIGLGAVTVNTANATVEAGDAVGFYRTVWYSYTPTADSIITINTTGTNFSYSFVGVYLGNSINALTLVNFNNSSNSNAPYTVTFKAKANTTFQIYAGSTNSRYYGDLKLTLFSNSFTHTGSLFGPDLPSDVTPVNDSFQNRKAISGANLTVIGYTADATIEASEPFNDGKRTLWYTYTPTTDSIITLDNTGTEFDYNFITVYIGGAINNLNYVNGRQSSNNTAPYSFSFIAKANTTFQICVGSTIGNRYGTHQFTLTSTSFTPSGSFFGPDVPTSYYPTNDNFANRTTLSGSSLTALSYIPSASVEANEPFTNTGGTVWYTYTPTSNTTVTLNNAGTDFTRSFIAVYAGSAINALTPVIGNYSTSLTPYSVQFNATANTPYQICVGSYSSGYFGTFLFSLKTAGSTPSYTINVSSNSTELGGVSGGGIFNTNAVATCIATPSPGTMFVNWTEMGKSVSTSKTYSFKVTKNRTLVANFKSIPTFTINVSSNSLSLGDVSGGGIIIQNAVTTCIATPSPGTMFVNWTEMGKSVSTSKTYSFKVTKNRTLVANFKSIPTFTINVSSNSLSLGDVSGGGIIIQNAVATCIATPSPGKIFVNWTEMGKSVSTSKTYSFKVTKNRTLVANFK